MKLNRRRLRRLIKEEYSRVLEEMYGDHSRGHMGGHMGMGPEHPDYDLLGNVIQAATMDCMMKGVRSSDPEGVRTCCMNACANHNVMHHLDYVCEKVMNMLLMSGM